MKPKIKDGTKMNLYVDRSIVEILDARAAENNTSRSQYVERLVREADSSAAIVLRDEPNSAKTNNFDKAKKAVVYRIPRKPRNVK